MNSRPPAALRLTPWHRLQAAPALTNVASSQAPWRPYLRIFGTAGPQATTRSGDSDTPQGRDELQRPPKGLFIPSGKRTHASPSTSTLLWEMSYCRKRWRRCRVLRASTATSWPSSHPGQCARSAHLTCHPPARAEHIPLDDRSVDAAMAVLTLHHWTDQAAGLRELRLIARGLWPFLP